MHKRFTGWFAALALVLLAAALPAQAQITAGREYKAIEPALATDNPAKIEVIEFFSYGCPHCSELNPTASKWSAKLPSEISFKRIPITFSRAPWANLAKLYYALETIGELEKHDAAVFDALHAKGLKLFDDKSILEWVSARGIDSKKFTDAYNSFGVISKVKRGDQMAQAYKIEGVPALAVDGKYLVLNEGITQGITRHDDLIARTDKVIDKARSERNHKK
jgi:thiol:disulfide interchange protein DsbA